MLLEAKKSLLLIIDVQENNIININHYEQLIANCRQLLLMAQECDVAVFASEHFSDKNGPTYSTLADLIPTPNRLKKESFSFYAEIQDKLERYTQIICAGIETHLCVLQTAFELLPAQKEVFVVTDATASKFNDDKKIALARLQQAGVQLITKQMILFEWTRKATACSFRKLSENKIGL